MRSIPPYSDESSTNFWPAFTDVMLAIVLALVLVVGIELSRLTDLGEVEHVQRRVAENAAFGRQGLRKVTHSEHEVEWLRGSQTTLRFERDPDNPFLQRTTFSDAALFAPDDTHLKLEGRQLLKLIGTVLQEQRAYIAAVQIQGHADNQPSQRFPDNLELASRRANEVFRSLYAEGVLDPLQHLMSATSFAEWVPVNRRPGQEYTKADLARDNSDEAKRYRNRRIEVLVFYRR